MTAAESGPDLTLVQFTDTHIMPAGKLMHGTVDTSANLAAALDMVVASGTRVDAFLLTGDLTDNGSPEAYRRLAAALHPVAESLGAQVIHAMGNHDERAAFRTELLGEPAADTEYDAVFDVRGLRVVVLDSSEPGKHDGHLSPAQLDWLGKVLTEPAPRGTVVVAHHPPLPSPVPTVHLLRLRQADQLAEVIAGTDVRLVVTGHAHHAGVGAVAGVPVWVGPALAYATVPVPPSGRLQGNAHAAFSRIDVFGDQVVVTAVPVTPAAEVYDVDEAERLAMVRAVVGPW
ncbi:metallophosphoesterase [Actinokineospora sp. NBRC 105648]|uniref:metallophosphoesterase n=1 Tax=Actinokineospora sp. NBRC 105648 TaxID=3032206 RepID=UPI0024A5CA88|nr:metallophosphoesterase [Actinokineospora sp. NBRC 105648]GLZ36511.1 3',5'-cyclic adenosine monophosphate phosphodiesterase CpdA [Actinokineospora sp. NBRC 105648]